MNYKIFLVSILACIIIATGGYVLAGSALDTQTYEKVKKGEKIFNSKCKVCHSLEANRMGPSLKGIIMRKFAIVKRFRYSDALRNRQGLRWTEDNLDAFLTNPKSFIPKNRMPFRGLKKKEDRENLITYLKHSS
ncbi:uncharacterized protein METZ01_LOCUS216325 [marine metagenome]|uniref:Cytochrome c domain-containing protein n=1 Tax=marine metagenome TaxID=408172 RepID=A0A382FND3_9ZZZZ|tara:strand:+ start:1760 stop:2161 length:402 start_codon:yes stop_codon:yes gene_type:complete